MKTREAAVLTAIDSDKEVKAGTLYANGDDLSFRYDSDYVTNFESYDLFPSMSRSLAPFFFSGLGPFSDSAPDRWGRKVLARSLGRNRVTESESKLLLCRRTKSDLPLKCRGKQSRKAVSKRDILAEIREVIVRMSRHSLSQCDSGVHLCDLSV